MIRITIKIKTAIKVLVTNAKEIKSVLCFYGIQEAELMK